jgi:hypothetical protein
MSVTDSKVTVRARRLTCNIRYLASRFSRGSPSSDQVYSFGGNVFNQTCALGGTHCSLLDSSEVKTKA